MITPLALGALLLSGSASLGSPVPITPGLNSPSLDPRSPMWPRTPLPPPPSSPLLTPGLDSPLDPRSPMWPRTPLPPVPSSPSLDPRSPMWPRSPLPPIPRSPLPETTSFLVPRKLLPRDANDISRCGSHLTDERHTVVEEHFQKHKKPAPANMRTATEPIKVHFHVIYANETLESGYVPDEQLHAQIDVLNDAYSGTPLSWKLATITRTQNEDWFKNAGPESQQQDDMKAKLRVGGAKDLNVYTVSFTEEADGILGYSTFPSDYADEPDDDGVVMQHSTLPGGTMENYDLGATLTHEAGHWAGLYHTFQGGCDEPGDAVDDTPAEATAASGCPTKRKTCKNSDETDPVNNYMDYTYDSCMTGFTPGQAERMADQMRTYRGLHV